MTRFVASRAKSRQLTREEQDKINKTRKSVCLPVHSRQAPLTCFSSAHVLDVPYRHARCSGGVPFEAPQREGFRRAAHPCRCRWTRPQGHPCREKKGVMGKKRGANEMAGAKEEPTGKKPKA